MIYGYGAYSHSFLQTFNIENFAVYWAVLEIEEFEKERDVKINLVLDYAESKVGRSTLKLLVPVLLKSMGSADSFASLPEVLLNKGLFTLYGVIISQKSFLHYMRSITNG